MKRHKEGLTKVYGFWSQNAWAWVLALSLICKLLTLFVPKFPNLLNWDDKRILEDTY